MGLSSAYILVAHGSRDPRPQLAIEQLAVLVSQKLQQKYRINGDRFEEQKKSLVSGRSALTNSKQTLSSLSSSNSTVKDRRKSESATPLVEIAYLELAPLSLHERIKQIAEKCENLGIESLQILPLFLLPGVHVREDIPREIELARETLKSKMAIALHPYLGSYRKLPDIWAKQLENSPVDATILLAHGSRRRGGNEFCEAIATRLGAIAAYTLVSPTLEERLNELAKMGAQKIAILPYFLFSGSIIDAIAKQVEQLKQTFPQLQLQLGEPLGAATQLVDVIIERIEEWKQ